VTKGSAALPAIFHGRGPPVPLELESGRPKGGPLQLAREAPADDGRAERPDPGVDVGAPEKGLAVLGGPGGLAVWRK
jgi:hypothetical protein